MTGFQSILIAVFAVAIIAGVVLFGTSTQAPATKLTNVTIWGTLDADTFTTFTDTLIKENDAVISVTYSQKDADSFENTLLKALAEGSGPDIILIGQDEIIANKKRLYEVPYEYYPLRDFKDTFIEEGELFLTSTGVLAFPFNIDPMVTYWNRDLLSAEGISTPPKYWDEFLKVIPQLTKKDSSLNIYQSAFALGEFVNIAHAKEILATLMLQAGNPIVEKSDRGYSGLLTERLGFSVAPAEAALNFYTEFSNPTKDVYSWNRSLSKSTDLFLSGDLALYFGFASELRNLKEKNPNLNFDVTYFPYPRQNPLSAITYGRMSGFAIMKNSKKALPALNAIKVLTSNESLKVWARTANLPSVRRDLLVDKSSSSYSEVFNSSAVRSRAWLDPQKAETTKLFKTMIESVVSGRSYISEALQDANTELESLF